MQTAKLFKNGHSQALRLPAEFRFEGNEVEIRRDPATGDVILSPPNKPFADWLEEHERLLASMTGEERKDFDHACWRPNGPIRASTRCSPPATRLTKV
jgi:antitoxin VapB